MSCMRCGKEVEENQVFCAACLQDMERHPVKPGTPIQLPNRKIRGTTKRTGFKLAASKWQDKIFRLKYTIFWLLIIIILLITALILSICMLLQVTPEWLNELLLGQPNVDAWVSSVIP